MTQHDQEAAEPPIEVIKARLDRLYLDGYLAGATFALGLYAYSSSQAWAVNGVQYVGTTGTTLARALEDMKAHVDAMRAGVGA